MTSSFFVRALLCGSSRLKSEASKIEGSSSGVPDNETSSCYPASFQSSGCQKATIGSCTITSDRYRRNVQMTSLKNCDVSGNVKVELHLN
jgi:hypothetical protein